MFESLLFYNCEITSSIESKLIYSLAYRSKILFVRYKAIKPFTIYNL